MNNYQIKQNLEKLLSERNYWKAKYNILLNNYNKIIIENIFHKKNLNDLKYQLKDYKNKNVITKSQYEQENIQHIQNYKILKKRIEKVRIENLEFKKILKNNEELL